MHRSWLRRLVAVVVLACAPIAAAQSPLTTGAPNASLAAPGGMFINLTSTVDMDVTAFDYYANVAAGNPVTVDIYVRSGTYVGNDTNPGAWSLFETVTATSNGTTILTNLPLQSKIHLATGATTGVYIVGTVGGVRYTGTGQVSNWSNAQLALFSDMARSNFSLTANTPRTFAGKVYYTLTAADPVGACCMKDRTCSTVALSACTPAVGSFRGEGIACAPSTCPPHWVFTIQPTTNTTTAGAFIDVTAAPSGAVQISAFEILPNTAAGNPVTVEVRLYPGSYVGHDANAAGWTLFATVNTVSAGIGAAGAGVRTRIDLPLPIIVPAGATVGVCLAATTGSMWYVGSATNINNGEVTFASERIRTALFGGTLFTPRGFVGRMEYLVLNSASMGACCRIDNTCDVSALSGCTLPNGIFRGIGVTCGSAECPNAGSCCNSDGSCAIRFLAAECAAGAVFTPGVTSCGAANCPQPGACCKADGSCTFFAQSFCETTGGVFTSVGTACLGAGCPQPGACCLGNGGCVALLQTECTSASGASFHAATLCASAGCWTGPILYHNGGIVSDPAAGPSGEDVSQAPLTSTTSGYNWNFSANIRVADDFTIPAGQVWTLNKFYTWGYQTGVPTSPLPFTFLYVRIYDRDPRDANAVIVFGDLSTNRLDTVNSAYSNINRTFNGAITDVTRPLFKLIANLPDVQLSAGTYWIEYTAVNGVTAFLPPVTTPNFLPFGNSIQFNVTNWVGINDGAYLAPAWSNSGGKPVGLPFVIEGVIKGVGVCCQTDGSCTVATPGVPNASCATGTLVPNGTCTPNTCPPPASGVCCRGATCNAAVAQAACLASGTAGAFFSPSGNCNAPNNNISPCCHSDYNKIDGITVADIFDFLNSWFAGSPFAAIGTDGTSPTLAVQNIFDFLNAWFAGGC